MGAVSKPSSGTVDDEARHEYLALEGAVQEALDVDAAGLGH
jgi:hypothetical protein